MRSSIASIASSFESHYWAADGLARLDPEDSRAPFSKEFPPTVRNENGILFLAEIMLELKLKGWDISQYKSRVRATLDMLKSDIHKPLYDRRPGDKNLMNSHDNMIGILILCQIFRFDFELEKIYKHGVRKLWQFNNLDPEAPWTFEAWLLPREQALHRLAVGKMPGFVSIIWLTLSIFTKSKHKRMMRLRMESMKMSNPRGLSTWIVKKWWESIGGYAWFAESIKEYYTDPQQPYRRLCNILK